MLNLPKNAKFTQNRVIVQKGTMFEYNLQIKLYGKLLVEIFFGKTDICYAKSCSLALSSASTSREEVSPLFHP